jgi:hypothetical protein
MSKSVSCKWKGGRGTQTFDELVAQETHGHRRLTHASISKNHLRGGARPKFRCGRARDLEEERNEGVETKKNEGWGEEGKRWQKVERFVRCGEAPSVDDAVSFVVEDLYFYFYSINDTQPRLKCVECCPFAQLLR